jgi:hypothetical protein
MRSFLRWLVSHMSSPRVIYDREGKSPYLSRYYIIGRPYMADGSEPIDRFGNPKPEAIFPKTLGFAIYLHKFHRSDDDNALHNHPWEWARSLILAGGYSEERREPDRETVVRRTIRPGDWVKINADHFHRVDLLEDDSWSFFIAGPKTSDWGFWERESGASGPTIPWREFIARIRGASWQ